MLSDRKGGWNDGNQPFQEIISAQFLFLVLLPAPVRCERIDEQHRSEKEAAPSHSFVYRSLECCRQWLVRVVGGGGCGDFTFCMCVLVPFWVFHCTLSLAHKTSAVYRIPLPSETPAPLCHTRHEKGPRTRPRAEPAEAAGRRRPGAAAGGAGRRRRTGCPAPPAEPKRRRRSRGRRTAPAGPAAAEADAGGAGPHGQELPAGEGTGELSCRSSFVPRWARPGSIHGSGEVLIAHCWSQHRADANRFI